MSLLALDIPDLLQSLPDGVWAAISEADGTVLAFGPDIESVAQEAETKGEHCPLMVRKPPEDSLLFL